MYSFGGQRVYWNRKTMIQEDGTRIQLPYSISSRLPDIPLEGYLTVNNSRTNPVKFHVLDIIQVDKTLQQRMEELRKSVAPDDPVLAITPPIQCTNLQHVLHIIQANPSMELIFKNPKARYYEPQNTQRALVCT
jgi:hypothetical protein